MAVIAGFLSLLLLTGWTLYPPGNFGKLLVAVRIQGGLCPGGKMCTSVTAITLTGECKGDNCKRARITDEELKHLRQDINTADFVSLKKKKPGDCPGVSDGQDTIYTFYTPKETVEINACEYVVDLGAQPFKTLLEILGKKP